MLSHVSFLVFFCGWVGEKAYHLPVMYLIDLEHCFSDQDSGGTQHEYKSVVVKRPGIFLRRRGYPGELNCITNLMAASPSK